MRKQGKNASKNSQFSQADAIDSDKEEVNNL